VLCGVDQYDCLAFVRQAGQMHFTAHLPYSISLLAKMLSIENLVSLAEAGWQKGNFVYQLA